MTPAESFAADRRRNILTLMRDQGYALNEDVLQTALESLHHRVSVEVVRADLQLLSDLGLATLEQVGRVLCAALTDRGLDVARGRARVPGIREIRPGEK